MHSMLCVYNNEACMWASCVQWCMCATVRVRVYWCCMCETIFVYWCCRHFDALGVTLAERTMVANSSGVTLRASSRSHKGVPGSSLSING